MHGKTTGMDGMTRADIYLHLQDVHLQYIAGLCLRVELQQGDLG